MATDTYQVLVDIFVTNLEKSGGRFPFLEE